MQGKSRYLVITRPMLSESLLPNVERALENGADDENEEQVAIFEDEDEVSAVVYNLPCHLIPVGSRSPGLHPSSSSRI